MIRLDTPSPSDTRPGATCASVAADMPRMIGLRVWIGMTPLATPIRCVWLAMSVMSVIASPLAVSPSQAV